MTPPPLFSVRRRGAPLPTTSAAPLCGRTADAKRGGGVSRDVWAALALCLGLILWPVRPAWPHSEEAAVAVKTYTPVTVNGTLEDWVRRLESSNWTGKLQVKKGQVIEWIRGAPIYLNALTSHLEAGTVKSPEDFSAAIYALWDERHFYIAAVVHDDELVTQHQGEDIWQDDVLELWLDCRHDAVTHTLFQEDEYQLGFSPAGPGRPQAVAWAWRNPRTEPVIQAMTVASSLTPDGYVLEAAVPWAALQGCHPTVGGMIGFNISMADKDNDQLWTHVAWSGQLHSDPSQFGHLYFVDAPIDLFPADVFEVPADSPSLGLLKPSRSHQGKKP